MSEKKAKRWAKSRMLVFDHYGWKCVCCGEDISEFLSIDHVGGGGAEHRKEIGGTGRIYHWLVKNDFPEGFETVCRNCNWGRYINNGICPHQNHER